MITRALVIKKADIEGYKWWVTIPALGGIPDSQQEYNNYKSDLAISVTNNSNLEETLKKDARKLAAEVYNAWGKSEKSNNLDIRFDVYNEKITDNKIKVQDYCVEAYVCGIGGMQNLITEGDCVFVGFEDNDMGKPIILGHLLTSELESKRKNYPNIHINSLQVDKSAKLPKDTQLKANFQDYYDLEVVINTMIQQLARYQELITNISNRIPNDQINNNNQ